MSTNLPTHCRLSVGMARGSGPVTRTPSTCERDRAVRPHDREGASMTTKNYSFHAQDGSLVERSAGWDLRFEITEAGEVKMRTISSLREECRDLLSERLEHPFETEVAVRTTVRELARGCTLDLERELHASVYDDAVAIAHYRGLVAEGGTDLSSSTSS